MNKTIKDYKSKNLLEFAKKALKDNDKKYNSIINFIGNQKCLNPKGRLANVPFVAKDNFDFKGHITTQGSKILENHISITTATVIKKLIDEGAVLIGKSNLDEFAMGGTGFTSSFGKVKNPTNLNWISGGSSSGSAVAVSGGAVPFSIGSDTGDSVRDPAAFCSTIGFKPTYGLISRYGLGAFSPSLDTVGFFTNTIRDQALLLSVTAGFDSQDFTSANVKKQDYFLNLKKVELKGKKIFYVKEILDHTSSYGKKDLLNFIDKLKQKGAIVDEISFGKELIEVGYLLYQNLSFAEATSHLQSINGISYADVKKVTNNHFKDAANTRSELFSKIVQQRIALGANSMLDEHQKDLFLKAKKIRRLYINRWQEIIKDYDLMFSLASTTPTKIRDASYNTNASISLSNLLQIANMTGTPSITIPYSRTSENVCSLELVTDIFEDQKLLNYALTIEKMIEEKD